METNQIEEKIRELENWLIENPTYNKLNKLKKTNPEAFFYWYKSIIKSTNFNN